MREELETKDKEINNYRIDLLDKDEEIREKEKTILELENLIVSAAKNDESELTATQNAIANLKRELEEKERAIATHPNSPQNTQDLKTLIKGWKRQAKSTRDWTKANQLLSELENFL